MNEESTTHLAQSQRKVAANKSLLIPSIEQAYTKYFEKITELQAGDIITSAQCKFCNHPMRAEAESKWEQTKGRGGKGSYSMVIKFLNEHEQFEEHGGVKFNLQNVSVHINHHYEQQLKRIQMREYGKHLASIMNYKVGKEEMFEGMIQSFQLKLFETAANMDLDAGKQVSMMTQLGKQILETSMVQAKLRGDIDTLDVYKDKVQNVIVNFISSEKDTTRQRELLEQLDIAKAELIESQ